MLVSNRRTLEFALRRLRHHRDGEGCPCALYEEFLFYDPEREAAAGHVRAAETDLGRWRCECTLCGRAFAVEYGEMHSSWWQWTPLEG